MGERTRCCVPFCRRSTKEKYNEWICGPHWRTIQPHIKQAWHRTKRRMRKVLRRKPQYREYWKMPPGSRDRLRAVDMWARVDQAWKACKHDAIEGAAGIT